MAPLRSGTAPLHPNPRRTEPRMLIVKWTHSPNFRMSAFAEHCENSHASLALPTHHLHSRHTRPALSQHALVHRHYLPRRGLQR